MKNTVLILSLSILASCASSKPPVAMVVSDHRYKVNTETESEEIWRLAGYGEHQALIEAENKKKQALNVEPTAQEIAAQEYERDVQRYFEIERWRRSTLPSLITAYFEPGQSNLSFNTQQRRDMSALILRTAKVDIRGRTDSSGEDQSNDDLALKRALAAKRYLLEMGVEERKISVNYSAENNYISDEFKSKGQSKNRRVEIEFVLGAIPNTTQ